MEEPAFVSLRSGLLEMASTQSGKTALALLQLDGMIPGDPRLAGMTQLRSLAEARDAAERARIVAALERTGGQIGKAARLLRAARTTLWEKMQKPGLS